ncbi:aldolase [Herbiconiux daphne]|uniref:Aldolase n=1 Tax=Herbiconiux daphne TaxID=2970914 RepID=A0ABT2GX36_9MICO|nr:aldolase [Herbiconiux daphne]MCS5732516.1 aldolase [Herbiconiux daphne]
MPSTNTTTGALLAPLKTPEGGFAMVALDQRESLREMFPPAVDGTLVDDAVLRSFKETASRILTPHATGVLVDRPLGVTLPERPDWIDRGCGLILAADVLHSVRGAGVVGSSVDQEVTADFVRATGAAAVKLLIIWRRGVRDHERTVQQFLELADAAGVASFVEGIVRPPEGGSWVDAADRHAAILEAAADLSRGASVYKAEVPGYLPGDLSQVRDQSRALTQAAEREWVVLSNGVQQADFADAVAESCAGGASGFLAGRAIWADTVVERDPAEAMADRSVARLKRLSGIVRKSRLEGVKEEIGE